VIDINRMNIYINILILIIIILISTLLYFKNTKESYQDLSNSTIIRQDIIAPLIQENPEMKGVFNTDQGIDISGINPEQIANDLLKTGEKISAFVSTLPKDSSLSNVPVINTTEDTRPITDKSKICDQYKIQLEATKKYIDVYRKNSSWSQVRQMSFQIDNLTTLMSKSGC